MPLDAIRIILVEPAGSLNVGSVARVMKNMGLRHLVLVNPHCDHLGAEARQMAVHAPEILAAAQVVETLPQALAGCIQAVATLGRSSPSTFQLETPRQALPWLLEGGTLKQNPLEQSTANYAALIFGPEDRGLNNAELHHAHRFVCIPADPAYPSLNLAQAVAICCYELHQHAQLPLVATQVFSAPQLPAAAAPLEELERFYQHLETFLLKVGYLYPHTASSRMKKFRRLFHRTMPNPEEIAMLRGILSQTEWAMQQHIKNT